jgi:hypothetical protein
LTNEIPIKARAWFNSFDDAHAETRDRTQYFELVANRGSWQNRRLDRLGASKSKTWYNIPMSSTPENRIDISVLPPVSLDKMVRAVEKVRERLKRACTILNDNNILFAVVGGNAVAAWVSRVDEAAVRNTQDVDILVRRQDFEQIKSAFEAAGFVHGNSMNVDFFLEGPNAKIRDAIYILFANEKVKERDFAPTPDVTDVDLSGDFPIIDLQSLVKMKLTSYRDKDRTHLRDMIGIGLVDSHWPVRFESELGGRLQLLLDDPDG